MRAIVNETRRQLTDLRRTLSLSPLPDLRTTVNTLGRTPANSSCADVTTRATGNWTALALLLRRRKLLTSLNTGASARTNKKQSLAARALREPPHKQLYARHQ